VDHSVAPAAYFIARINTESNSFLPQSCRFFERVSSLAYLLTAQRNLQESEPDLLRDVLFCLDHKDNLFTVALD
jgi:hypothetical protein